MSAITNAIELARLIAGTWASGRGPSLQNSLRRGKRNPGKGDKINPRRENLRKTGASGKYTPLSQGIPTYFLPMLLYSSRNTQYERAIHTMIDEVFVKKGDKLTVVDFGCGMGYLSACCLGKCDKLRSIIMLDLNTTMINFCKMYMMNEEGYTENKNPYGAGTSSVSVLSHNSKPMIYLINGDQQVLKHFLKEKTMKVDCIISEILGTTGIFSESMLRYIRPLLNDTYMNTYNGRFHIIPSAQTTYIVPYEVKEPLLSVLSRTLECQPRDETKRPSKSPYIIKGSTSDHIHGFPLYKYVTSMQNTEDLCLRRDWVETRNEVKRQASKEINTDTSKTDTPAIPAARVLCLEWSVNLYGDVYLSHSLSDLESNDFGSCGKYAQWGFFMWFLNLNHKEWARIKTITMDQLDYTAPNFSARINSGMTLPLVPSQALGVGAKQWRSVIEPTPDTPRISSKRYDIVDLKPLANNTCTSASARKNIACSCLYILNSNKAEGATLQDFRLVPQMWRSAVVESRPSHNDSYFHAGIAYESRIPPEMTMEDARFLTESGNPQFKERLLDISVSKRFAANYSSSGTTSSRVS